MVNNTKYGSEALNNITTGRDNTAIGAYVLTTNTTGTNNTAVGSNSAFFNEVGSDNTSVGAGSLCFNVDGSLNTAVGSSALENNRSGSHNVALGAQSLFQNDAGKFNVAVGAFSGLRAQGAYNTFIGGETSFDSSAETYQYSTAIGYKSVISDSHQIVLGGLNEGVYPSTIIGGKAYLPNFDTETATEQQIVPKSYVDSVSRGLLIKEACRCIASNDVVISPSPIDVTVTFPTLFNIDQYQTLVGDRVLINNQTDKVNNGIYVVTDLGGGVYGWERSADMPVGSTADNAYVLIQLGELYQGTSWLEGNAGVDVGTDPIHFNQYGSSGLYRAGDGLYTTVVGDNVLINVKDNLDFIQYLDNSGGTVSVGTRSNELVLGTIGGANVSIANGLTGNAASFTTLETSELLSAKGGITGTTGSFTDLITNNIELTTINGYIYPPTSAPINVVDSSINGVLYPTFVSGDGIQPDIYVNTSSFTYNPDSGDIRCVPTLKIFTGTNNQIAFGENAGITSQGNNTVAVGKFAGEHNQGTSSISVGLLSGRYNQGQSAVAIGDNAGVTGQSGSSIAIGIRAASFNQGSSSVAIGNNAGNYLQGNDSVAIGLESGINEQGVNSTAIGFKSGSSSQGIYSVSVGSEAGTTSQGNYAVSVGNSAGKYNQGVSAVAVGNVAGYTGQGNYAVSVGVNSGNANQGNYAVAIGDSSGKTNQGVNAVSIGVISGYNAQGASSVAIGNEAGYENQGENSVAIGRIAGQLDQSANAIAIGHQSGQTQQGSNAISVGYLSGNNRQSDEAVAIGNAAGTNQQKKNAIAIGSLAGYSNQGENSIAIGNKSGQSFQHNNSIVLNATGLTLNSSQSNSFFVKPVRNNDATYHLKYNESTGEISYYQDASSGLSDVLAKNNSAGNYDINMNNHDILQVNELSAQNVVGATGSFIDLSTNNIQLNTINGDVYPPLATVPDLETVLSVGNSAGATDLNMNGNNILNANVIQGNTIGSTSGFFNIVANNKTYCSFRNPDNINGQESSIMRFAISEGLSQSGGDYGEIRFTHPQSFLEQPITGTGDGYAYLELSTGNDNLTTNTERLAFGHRYSNQNNFLRMRMDRDGIVVNQIDAIDQSFNWNKVSNNYKMVMDAKLGINKTFSQTTYDLDVSGNSSITGNAVFGGLITANGGITGENGSFTTLSTSGLLTANGGITGENGSFTTLSTSGLLSANGGITGENGSFTTLETSGLLSANGGITGTAGSFTNLATSGLLTANGGITGENGSFTTLETSELLSANGGITGENGSFTTLETSGLLSANGGITGTAGSFTTLATSGLLTANGGITGENGSFTTLSTSGLLTANGGITGENGSFTTLATSGLLTANGGITGATGSFTTLEASGLLSANGGITGENGSFTTLETSGLLSANGGITGATGSFTNLLTDNIQLSTINGNAYPPAVPNLQEVLNAGNSAGSTDLNMNGNHILDASNVVCNTVGGTAVDSVTRIRANNKTYVRFLNDNMTLGQSNPNSYQNAWLRFDLGTDEGGNSLNDRANIRWFNPYNTGGSANDTFGIFEISTENNAGGRYQNLTSDDEVILFGQRAWHGNYVRQKITADAIHINQITGNDSLIGYTMTNPDYKVVMNAKLGINKTEGNTTYDLDVSGNSSITGTALFSGLLTAKGGVDLSQNDLLNVNNLFVQNITGYVDASFAILTSSGLLSANGGITGTAGSFTTLATSGLISANGGITGATGSFATMSTSGLLSANGGITGTAGSFTTLATSGLLTANGGITGATGSFTDLSATNIVFMNLPTCEQTPTNDYQLTTKTYVDSQLASNYGTLAQILENGNSADIYNIDMSNSQLLFNSNVKIGTLTTGQDSSVNCVAIGSDAGITQDSQSIAMGYLSGRNQKHNCIAIGYNSAGDTTNGVYQNEGGIAIGANSAITNQGASSIAIGGSCARLNQSAYAVAMGFYAGAYTQGQKSVAIGNYAGYTGQGQNSVAIGNNAGYAPQGQNSVAIGNYAGFTGQGQNSVAIGNSAGYTLLGQNSVAVGFNTAQCGEFNTLINSGVSGVNCTGQNNIIINTNSTLTSYTRNNLIVLSAGSNYIPNPNDNFGFFVKPIRAIDSSGDGVLTYNYDSGQIMYSNAFGVTGAITAASFNATSDYRIKETPVPLSLASSNEVSSSASSSYSVDGLNPVVYKNTLTQKTDIGFIAHELQEHYPFLVSGEKDGEKLQSVNYTGLIGVLVKEIQELKARVQSLEALQKITINSR